MSDEPQQPLPPPSPPAWPPPAWGQPGSFPPPAPGVPLYGAPPYAVPPKTPDKAIWAVVLGAMSVLLSCGFFTGIPAIVVGRKAMKEIDASDGSLGGRPWALTGVILGAVGSALGVLMILGFAAFVALVSTIDVEDPYEVTPRETAMRSEWVDACQDLELGGESGRCGCAFDEIVTQVDSFELELMLDSMRFGYLSDAGEREDFDRAMRACS